MHHSTPDIDLVLKWKQKHKQTQKRTQWKCGNGNDNGGGVGGGNLEPFVVIVTPKLHHAAFEHENATSFS